MTRLLLTFFAIYVTSCSPKIGSTIISKQAPLADNAQVVVLQKEDPFHNDGFEIGSIKSGDNGFSTNCSYQEVIDKLKQLAKQNGANIIKITQRKGPDHWSSCERIKANIYRVPDVGKHERQIEWSENRKLTWDDFKGPPNATANPEFAATTWCGFGFEANRVSAFSRIKFFTRNFFECQLSWVRPDQKNKFVLEHEQAHFDLCEVYTRRLRKKLEGLSAAQSNFSIASEIYRQIFDAYLDRQERYDKETDHGRNSERQQEWLAIILWELQELNAYSL